MTRFRALLLALSIPGCSLYASNGDADPRRQAESYDPNQVTSPPEAPPPVSFPEADRVFAPAVRAWATNANVSVKRAWLTSSKWTIKRNRVSGAVTAREAATRLYYKGSNGPKELATNCYRKDYCTLRQDNLGGNSWSDATLTCEGAEPNKHHVDCGAVDQLAGGEL